MGVATSFMGPSAHGLELEAGVVAIIKGDRVAKMPSRVAMRPRNREKRKKEGMVARCVLLNLSTKYVWLQLRLSSP